MDLYPIARPFLFGMDAEQAHHFTLRLLPFLHRIPGLLPLMGNRFSHPSLERTAFGLRFSNPVGLAAGLDKNAEVVDEMAALGFGFVEIGTVTPRPQPGNPLPRLFRLKKDEALINRMGFNNVGVDLVAARLSRRKSNIPVGGNIGKNKDTANADAVKDYERCFEVLFDVVDYFVVNVSSPNTPGLRELQEKDSLLRILSTLQHINQGRQTPKPLLLKIAPDLSGSQIDDVIEISSSVQLSGLIATNTTIERKGLNIPQTELDSIGAGGLSGKPLRHLSTSVVKHLANGLAGSGVQLIGSGGVMTADDAIEKFNSGATLVQLYTGFVYRGPGLIEAICRRISTN